jgi:hypothetical protein
MGDYTDQRYSVELLAEDSDDVEQVLAREDRLDVARTLFELMQAQFPRRVIMLRDGSSVVACSHDD